MSEANQLDEKEKSAIKGVCKEAMFWFKKVGGERDKFWVREPTIVKMARYHYVAVRKTFESLGWTFAQTIDSDYYLLNE